MEELVGADYKHQGKGGDGNFADEADDEGAKALPAHFAEVGAQADTGKGEEERPAGKVGERGVLVIGEKADGGEDGDEQKTEDELREFLPKEGGFVGDDAGLAAGRVIDGVGEDNEADEGVAGGFDEDGEFSGGVGIECAGGSGFGGVVDGEAGPGAIGVIAEMERVADEREDEERDGAQGEDRGDGEGGVFVFGVDSALRGNDGADAADGGADGEERSEFGAKAEETAEKGHEDERAGNFDEDEEEADAAKFGEIAEKEAGAEQYDSGFQPEFAGGDAVLEDSGDTDGVGDGQADEDGPEDVFDVGNDPVMGFGAEVDVFFEEFSGKPDDGKESNTGEQPEESRGDGERRILGESNRVGHDLVPFLGGECKKVVSGQ